MTLIRGGAISTSGFREEISRVQTDILDCMNFRLNDFSLNIVGLRQTYYNQLAFPLQME